MPRWLSVLRRVLTPNKYTTFAVTLAVLALVIYLVYVVQEQAESLALPEFGANATKDQLEVFKLRAEIQQIRSDTLGSLFWLKLIALLVTVGGAVGGYLLGQSQTSQRRIDFENRKNVDAVYQSMVQELSNDKSPLLRAATAVKLGMVLRSFPAEWAEDDARREQLIQLTKQVLAASLAIEDDVRVRKALTIALVRHKPEGSKHSDARDLNLSEAKAFDAYWAKADFTYSDFYKADLTDASLRESILHKAQFRQTTLHQAVLRDADCREATFKFADLKGADLRGVNFDKAKIWKCDATGVKFDDTTRGHVDVSEEGDGSRMVGVKEWLSGQVV